MPLKVTIPASRIAQYPLEKRSSSRMLVYDRANKKIQHLYFKDIVNYFNSGDLVIVNNTKVMKARLLGHKKTGAKIELFLVNKREGLLWECLVKPLKRVSVGERIFFDNDNYAEVISIDRKLAIATMSFHVTKWDDFLDKHGRVPLPPYIKRDMQSADIEWYQTVYAKDIGAVAAPTAGLHFNEEIIKDLKQKQVDIDAVTLHVGLGTFQSVSEQNLISGQLHSEEFKIKQDVADKINNVFINNKKFLAVGTTVVRVLESSAIQKEKLAAKSAHTKLFIKPGFEFKILDCLLTNFHLPESSLIYLVESFIGEEALNFIYSEAVKENYRFYSYGDCMLIL